MPDGTAGLALRRVAEPVPGAVAPLSRAPQTEAADHEQNACAQAASGKGARVPYGAIVRHIRANLSRRITVDELAGIARLSVFQLSRAFRREHETTPYGLVLEIRIRHATDMLGAGATIAETALHAGFADQSHFTRHFKRLTGMTPKQYSVDSAASA
jgi:AraC-like DNA-binding protein